VTPPAAPAPAIVALGSSSRERRRFLRAGMDVYRGDPNFVAELEGDLLVRTDPARNPFFRHAEVDHLVAVRDGRDVGRIAAIRNRLAEEFRKDRTGYFGWFECADDPAAARALLDAARARLAARGCDAIQGPVSYSTNDACGLLVEGFDGPPVLMMSYNPPWYEALLRGAGLEPAEDLLAWDVREDALGDVARAARIVERARSRHGWSLRPLDMGRFDEEIRRIRTVYNSAWESNWGFVPMTEEEFAFAAVDMRRIVDPDLVFLVERGGEALAFSLSLPDFNQVLARMGGSLFPFGWAKALWYGRRINALRVLALGVVPGARNQGIEAALYLETIQRGVAKGFHRAECSWTLERNTGINRVLETVGGRPYRRYRLYQGAIPTPVGA
jgi:GNAT superfamily N-acetyltransferase